MIMMVQRSCRPTDSSLKPGAQTHSVEVCGATKGWLGELMISMVQRGTQQLGPGAEFIIIIIIIIKFPNEAIALTPSAPRPTGAAEKGSTAPLCLQLLRTSQRAEFLSPY
jgi:hypothetical protein